MMQNGMDVLAAQSAAVAAVAQSAAAAAQQQQQQQAVAAAAQVIITGSLQNWEFILRELSFWVSKTKSLKIWEIPVRENLILRDPPTEKFDDWKKSKCLPKVRRWR